MQPQYLVPSTHLLFYVHPLPPFPLLKLLGFYRSLLQQKLFLRATNNFLSLFGHGVLGAWEVLCLLELRSEGCLGLVPAAYKGRVGRSWNHWLRGPTRSPGPEARETPCPSRGEGQEGIAGSSSLKQAPALQNN